MGSIPIPVGERLMRWRCCAILDTVPSRSAHQSLCVLFRCVLCIRQCSFVFLVFCIAQWFVDFATFFAFFVALTFARKFPTPVFAFVVAVAVVAGTVFPVEPDMAGAASCVCATF